jgi:hypothetical protein
LAIAVVLFGTGLLEVVPILRGESLPSPFLPTTQSQFAVGSLELLLGAALILDACPITATVACMVLFGVFAVASLIMLVSGQSTCGCLGSVKFHPGAAIALDLTALAGLSRLLLGRLREMRLFPRIGTSTSHEPISWLPPGILVSLIVLLIAAPWLSRRIGGLAPGDVFATPQVTNVGADSRGELRTFSVKVENRTDQPMRVIGSSSNCFCLGISGLRREIPPGGAGSVEVQVRFIGTPGRFTHQVFLYLDTGELRQIPFQVIGRVDADVPDPPNQRAQQSTTSPPSPS